MDSVRLQDSINRGLGTAARAIGVVCDAFRPRGAANPLATGNRFLQLSGAFNARDPRFRSAGLPSDPVWYGIFDAGYLHEGDYLVERLSGRTWFIGMPQSLLPATCVLANQVLTLTHPAGANRPGASAYGGLGIPLPVLSGFPGSLLHGGSARVTGEIPADARIGGAVALLPSLDGLSISRGDLLQDGRGRRYVVSDAECNSLGWRLDVRQAAS